MSRTYRRTKLNKKNRFFQHYFECFSHKEVENSEWIETWKYHSDNYYTKSSKGMKQLLKNKSYRKSRQEVRIKIEKLKRTDLNNDNFDILLKNKNYYSIKRELH